MSLFSLAKIPRMGDSEVDDQELPLLDGGVDEDALEGGAARSEFSNDAGGSPCLTTGLTQQKNFET